MQLFLASLGPLEESTQVYFTILLWEMTQATVAFKQKFVGFSPLNNELFSFETSFSLTMPLTHRIFISVQALTSKLNLSPLPALASRLVTFTMPTH